MASSVTRYTNNLTRRFKAIVNEGWHRKTRYSARSASTGLTEAALRAGK